MSCSTALKLLAPLCTCCLIAAAAIFIVPALNDGSAALLSHGDLTSPRLLVSLGLMTASIIGAALLWIQMLQCLEQERVRGWPLLRLFLLTWPTRYVPGTVPYHATRLMFAQKAGATTGAITTTAAYEAILQAAAAALLGIGCTVAAINLGRSLSSAYVLAVIPFVALPLLLQPRSLLLVVNRILTLLGRAEISRAALLSSRQILAFLVSYAVLYSANGTAFYLLLRWLFDSDASIWLAIGAYNVAGAAGIAVLFVPSGLGVREAVLVGFMSSSLSPEQALIAAGAARALTVIADLVPFAGLGLWELGTRTVRLSARVQLMRRAPSRVND